MTQDPSLLDTCPRPPTDHELMAASAAHPELFAQIFDRHAPAIHGFLSRRVGDLADDLLSETFLAAFRQRDRYRPERLDVRPWLYGIAANLLRRHHRDEAARYRALARSAARDDRESHAHHEVDAVERLDAQALRPALAAALGELDERDRETLLLIAWAGLGYAEAAAALDIPVGTVRSRLHRARRQLRERLATPLPVNCIAWETR